LGLETDLLGGVLAAGRRVRLAARAVALLGRLLREHAQALEQRLHDLARHGAVLDPPARAFLVQAQLLGGVLAERVVETEGLERPAVAREARVRGGDTEAGQVLATGPAQTDDDSHVLRIDPGGL